ncbi:MAG: alpha-E domain-containing protein [Chloroflexi bacterium]|nr:alpha-E domain-containing protein [Chloroflexota bacterium]
MALLCRVAENMFWLSRYVERAIAVIRLIDVTAHLELDAGDQERDPSDFWAPLLGEDASTMDSMPSPAHVRHRLAFDATHPGSLVSCVRRARTAAREVRESISSEVWEQVNTTYLALNDPLVVSEMENDLHAFFRRMRDALLLIPGLADATIAHDEPWYFLSLGQHLERADNVSRVVTLQGHLLSAPSTVYRDDAVRWLAVLRSVGSAEAYARYYSLRVDPPRVVEFLLLNPVFPQSVRHNLNAAWAALAGVSGAVGVADVGANPPARALGMLRARLEHATVDEVMEQGLHGFLVDLQNEIGRVSDQVTLAYFRQDPHVGRHMAVTRAAMILAAQQQ